LKIESITKKRILFLVTVANAVLLVGIFVYLKLSVASGTLVGMSLYQTLFGHLKSTFYFGVFLSLSFGFSRTFLDYCICILSISFVYFSTLVLIDCHPSRFNRIFDIENLLYSSSLHPSDLILFSAYVLVGILVAKTLKRLYLAKHSEVNYL